MLLLHQGLVVKSRLNKVGITILASVLCGKDETMQLVVCKCQTTIFWGMILGCISFPFCIPALMEVSPPGRHLDGRGQLHISFAFNSIGCTWISLEASL